MRLSVQDEGNKNFVRVSIPGSHSTPPGVNDEPRASYDIICYCIFLSLHLDLFEWGGTLRK